MIAQGADILPLLGARRPEQLAEVLRALDVKLGGEDNTRIEAAVPPGAAAGDRYAAAQMSHLDNER